MTLSTDFKSCHIIFKISQGILPDSKVMEEKQFADIIYLIKHSRSNALKSINTELINLYWNVGAYIHKKLSEAAWGEKTVDEMAAFIQKNHPELKGFNRRGLYRMKQFYETYSQVAFVSSKMTQIYITENLDNTIVSSPMTQLGKPDKKEASAGTQMEIYDIRDTILAKLSWTHHLTLFARTKTQEELEFYLRLCLKENYSVRQLERQINSSAFERTMIGNSKIPESLKDIHSEIGNTFKDSGQNHKNSNCWYYRAVSFTAICHLLIG